MSKFKVGDKVRTSIKLADERGDRFGIQSECRWKDEIARTVISVYEPAGGTVSYRLSGDLLGFGWPEYALVSAEPREFIVICRDKRDVIASHKRGDEIIKTAKATCAPSDEFNFETGAKLAFDRLMGREKPQPAPQPAPRFKVGDRVTSTLGNGTVLMTAEMSGNGDYLVAIDNYKCGHSGHPWSEKIDLSWDRRDCVWINAKDLSPAPEPKYYTGKVFAVRTKDDDATPRMQNRAGHIFEIKDGRVVGECWNFDIDYMRSFNSFGEFCKYCSATEWQEVKE